DRIGHARRTNQTIRWTLAEGSALPFADRSFDLVFQSVVFSSVLDGVLRRGMAAEMLRVCDVGGHILWIDHKRSRTEHLVGFDAHYAAVYFPGTTLCYRESVHPRYFPLMHHVFGWLAEVIYRTKRVGCDSWLLVFQK